MTDDARSMPRFAGLDGLRAVAVGLVVIYHLFPGSPLAGGFVGVDVFFVISGFLITALLLREKDASGRIDLADFWRRRARRLLPALSLVVMSCATVAWLIGGDLLVRLGEQVLGAATFSYNWTSIAGGTGYFADATPELFRNVWSLAVEEQFYVLWPLLLPLFLLLPRARWRAAVALAHGALSAGWMAVLVATGADLTRA
jgi:peptidoglycan/LPS O-acetylase OafA/YrhL